MIARAALAALAEEIVLRGILQRSISTSRIRAAAISTVVGVVSALPLLPLPAGWGPVVATIVVLAVSHAAGAATYALTGRVAAAWLARVVLVGLAAFASFT